MKKTSVYLTDREVEILRRLAREEGKSQATVLREALAAYDAKPRPERYFAIIGAALEGPSGARSIADIPEDELMRGFGEDDRTPYYRTLK